ncbi:nuclear transport factor 2 family protein [Streptomyces sp. SID486]|uniref:nuclear transport factor 2 family protein n=1 Tax=unclassified Streptomyces TaxID=2593676 RepID=UPI00137204CF|nr:nuclear transport factor 2 family protein [Streptomyces sp. SID2955]MYW42213.1 nuclear transport factor 2 family protein [Streptomyces sp. SID161]MYX96182.1 nuclear transport factor 2 family protein [Streptomyces sp. SID486]MYX97277.1 nuclear transport factor 2 family protein [Streptomyces sp. SID486]
MTATAVRTDVYAQVQHFYAHQMQALDGGRFTEYAATFTEDGTFQHSPAAEPAVGRAGIVAELERFHERFEGDPVQRRHWFNHIALEPQADGSLRSTVYALVVTVRPGGKPEIAPSCVVHDVLVVTEEGVHTRSRLVTHDQLA